MLFCVWGKAGGWSCGVFWRAVLTGWGVGFGRPGLYLRQRILGAPKTLLSISSVATICPVPCQNEEVLKKCAQEYLSRVKKEEQRYQALKVHAEEKLDR